MSVGRLTSIRRYPVKSMTGEVLDSADVEHRGLAGDRLWSLRDPDGKFGSGKSSRRFRAMPGLMDLVARYDGDVRRHHRVHGRSRWAVRTASRTSTTVRCTWSPPPA